MTPRYPTPTTPSSKGSGSMSGVARGSAVNLLGGGVSAVATFALTVVLARGMSTDDVGAVFTTTSLFLLLTSLGQLGTSTGLVYFLARRPTPDDATSAEAYLRTAGTPVFAVAALTGSLLLVLASPIAAWLGAGGQDGFVTSLRVLAVFTPFAAALTLYTTATRGLGAMRETAILDQMVRPVLQLVLVGAAVFSGSVGMVVLAWVFPYLPTAVVSRGWWRRRRGPVDTSGVREQARAVAREFWRFTAPRAVASVAQLAMQRLDIILVAALAGLEEAAIYTAATRFLVVGQLVGGAMSRAVQPRLARAISTGEHEVARELYQTATAWLVLLAWPLYLVMALASGVILAVFGDAYTVGAPVIVILSLTMLVATGCGMVDVVLTMAGRTSWNLYNVLLAFGVNVAADLTLIPRYGITGAAIGWAAAILCANLVPLAQVRFAVHLHPFGRATLTAIALSALCFGALPAVALPFLGSGLPALVAVLLVATLVFAGAAWRARHVLDLTSLVAGLRRTPGPRDAASLS